MALGTATTGAEAPTVGAATADAGRPVPRLLVVSAAVVPGALVHGTGHFVMGERRTAWRLLAAQGAGLGTMVLAVVGLAVSGASQYTIYPLIQLSIAGASLFSTSYFADVYGAAAPPGGTGEATLPPLIVAELGARYVRNETFSHRAFTVQDLEVRWRRFAVRPTSWIALDDDNRRLRLGASWRAWWPRPGTYLELGVAGTHHRYGTEGFSWRLGEIWAHGRLGLEAIGATLAGAFIEHGLGVGLGSWAYDGSVTERDELLLGRFAFGFYLGRDGEAQISYDHRHDTIAGGLKARGLGSGALGHFGLRAQQFFLGRWGLALEAQAGSAYVLGASVLFRHGESQ